VNKSWTKISHSLTKHHGYIAEKKIDAHIRDPIYEVFQQIVRKFEDEIMISALFLKK
jgi:hypothetical protein